MKPIKTLLSTVSLILASALVVYAEEKAEKGTESRAFSSASTYSSFTTDGASDAPAPEAPAAAASASDCGCGAHSGGGCSDRNTCENSVCRGLLWDPWVSLDYMHTWRARRNMPPLVTTGAFGQLPGATILFGGNDIGGQRQDAARLGFGAWLTPDQELGVGGKLFILAGERIGRDWNSLGAPLLARPFFDTNPLTPPVSVNNSLIVAGALGPGSINVNASNEMLGAEAYARYTLRRGPRGRIDLLAGYQFVRIDDSLHISNRSIIAGIPAIIAREDAFDVENQFHGGEIGVLGEFDHGAVTLSMMSKVALGDMHRKVRISGATTTTAGGPPVVAAGGLLALDTNIGRYSDDDFAFVPEGEIKLIYHVTRRLDLSIGYSLLYLPQVALAGDQIDTSLGGQPTVNSSHIPLYGPATPPVNPALPAIRDANFWLHQLAVGMTFSF